MFFFSKRIGIVKNRAPIHLASHKFSRREIIIIVACNLSPFRQRYDIRFDSTNYQIAPLTTDVVVCRYDFFAISLYKLAYFVRRSRHDRGY